MVVYGTLLAGQDKFEITSLLTSQASKRDFKNVSGVNYDQVCFRSNHSASKSARAPGSIAAGCVDSNRYFGSPVLLLIGLAGNSLGKRKQCALLV